MQVGMYGLGRRDAEVRVGLALEMLKCGCVGVEGVRVRCVGRLVLEGCRVCDVRMYGCGCGKVWLWKSVVEEKCGCGKVWVWRCGFVRVWGWEGWGVRSGVYGCGDLWCKVWVGLQ